MWSPWVRSPSRVVRTPSSRSRNFSCSSFKDVHTLFAEDEEEQQGTLHPLVRRPKLSIFHRIRLSTSVLRHWSASKPDPKPGPKSDPEPPRIHLPGSEDRVVLYSTSLRVVRRTFDDCRTVRSILRGFRVAIDERDLAMDARFLDELQGILGPKVGARSLSLPRVFIGGSYVGGADEILRLHECGELKKLIQGLPLAEAAGGPCETCGGQRFVLCDECSGSHKVFVERIGFRSCSACNENGLLRCPFCLPNLVF